VHARGHVAGIAIVSLTELFVTERYLFFFSSGRRHTRFKCDWSSDVCSSDLGTGVDEHPAAGSAREAGHDVNTRPVGAEFLARLRSEERRVGKECISWRAVDHASNKLYGDST